MSKLYKFDSGLLLLYETNNINKSTSIEISFDCGARCDGDLPGLAHFCEHMMFTGTDKLSRQEVSKRYFDFIKVNAFTSVDDIAFTGNIMTEKLPEYLTAVHDMICNSKFDVKAVEEEQKVVIQEIVQYADSHSKHAGYMLKYDLFGLDKYKGMVLGTKESVSSIKSTDVKRYIKKYFVKNNCVISICSPLGFGKIKGIIRKYFDKLMPSGKLKPLVNDVERLVDGEKVDMHYVDIEKNFFSLIFKFERKGPDLRYKAIIGVIANIIDDISDGLTKELRLDNSLVYGMWADYMINKSNSYLTLSTEISSQNIKPCINIMIDYIKNVIKDGFTKEQIKKEIEKSEYYWQTRVDSPNARCEDLTRYRFYGKFVSSKDIHDEVAKLSYDEINSVAKELFATSQLQVFVYGNAEKKDVYTMKQIENKFKK